MKSEKSLAEKIEEMEKEMPGIKEKLEYGSSYSWGYGSTWQTDDAEYMKIKDYKIVAAKKLGTSWDDDAPVSKWKEYAVVYYTKKDGEIKTEYLESIKTRGDHDYEDSSIKGMYPFIKLEDIDKKKIRVTWVDYKGTEGPSYKVDLYKKSR